jgi:glycolate oxidase FAD binding subunit
VLLDGHPEDIETEAAAYDLVAATGPPVSPSHRWSLRPSALRHLEGRGWLAEVGVGVVHHPDPQPPTPFAAEVVALHRRIKTTFDPTGRLAPGRVLAA